MGGRIAKLGMLAAAVLALPPARAQDHAWQQPEHLRGYVLRGFSTDGTIPGVGKGRLPKQQPAPVQTPVAERPKREADLSRATTVEAAAHLDPPIRLNNLVWPRMPHGHQDPTHPVGPAEPGSAAPRVGPASSGHTLPVRR